MCSRTCRRRKLKCDETKPVCGQCRKARRVCELSEIVFRHEQNSSLTRRPDALMRYYSDRRSFSCSNTWLSIPQQVIFVAEDPAGSGNPHTTREKSTVIDVSSPVQQPTHDEWEGHEFQVPVDSCSSPVPAISLANSSPLSARNNVMAAVALGGSPDHATHSTASAVAPDIWPSGNIDFILNPMSAKISPESPELTDNYPRSQSCTLQKDSPVQTDPEVSFLLRHFSEQPGKWLDLYFLDSYFETEVPMKALTHPLLKYAACAYAAKHLSRTRQKTDCPRAPVRHSDVKTTTTWPNHYSVDWAWYGAKYYAQAINLLRDTLRHTQDPDGSLGQQVTPTYMSDMQSISQPEKYSPFGDETLAAMAILCNYEFMSASDAEWARHLSGTMLVLELQQTGVSSIIASRPSKARKAIFWNFFRQDVYAAYILEVKTRLDIEDLHVWRSAGLQLDDQGFVLPSNGDREGAMKDDMISNALIWILSKVFNYISAAKESRNQHQPNNFHLDSGTGGSPSSQDHNHLVLAERWKAISHELDVWYDGLPDSFQPCARIERTATEPATESSPLRPVTIPEIWFTSAMCGSTMQTYHLARLLLLVHKPQSGDAAFRSGAVFDFMDIRRATLAELRYRSREIFGIALSSPFTSIMLHQTQTIFIAAQCLTEDGEKRMAVDILRRVNYDLGWETEYRVQQLLKQWHWEEV
ncbi:Zn(II)2Cys6 transcription factor [Penicillium riverlandense]|uniref:Zn(II)2Cys6 transcription factor n=1 Tax=Penicillium riverlandense TaxID=1903569 RepID=UPI00254667BC|nr:Zn(II)2Cys6 transcription factor [Penicillium riverlandense]KAJ5812456.1 Zn(II)2Cys6 transcription factor [Penicillium riverlandense]